MKQNRELSVEDMDQFIVDEIKRLFNSPHIYKYYQIIKDHECLTNESKLIMAWMAQLSGDNMRLSVLSRNVNPSLLEGSFLSFYFDLKAISGLYGNATERLVYSDKSLSIFEDVDSSFIYANALLTRGQIHNGLNEYRKASEYFYKAYEMFLEEEMMFAASVSLTNALLNYSKMANFNLCIKEGKKAMLMASSYDDGSNRYWDILYLPMGIAYLERHQVLLAIDYLIKAKQAIDGLELIHMHGLVEFQLFKAYKIHGDKKQLKKIVEDTRKLFSDMRYPIMIQFLRYGELLKDEYLTVQQIEELKMMYQETDEAQSFLVEMLVYLGNKNKESYLELEEFAAYVSHTRAKGDIVNLQVLLLLLADYYYIRNEIDHAKEILEEVVRYVKEYSLIAALYLYPYECWPLIQKIDHSIKRKKIEQPYFTEKEMEILFLLEQGLSNKEVGEKLFISIGTVKWHINHILSKLHAKNRVQAVYEAKKIGLFKS